MRNTTMRETLEAALSVQNAAIEGRSNDEILSAVKATRRELRKEETGKKPRSITTGKHEAPHKVPVFGKAKEKLPVKDNLLGKASPRYVTPPSKLNPFSHHGYIGDPANDLVRELTSERVGSDSPAPGSGAPAPGMKASAEHWFGEPRTENREQGIGNREQSGGPEKSAAEAELKKESEIQEPEGSCSLDEPQGAVSLHDSAGPVLVPAALPAAPPVLTLVSAPVVPEPAKAESAEELTLQAAANLEWLERPSPFSGHLKGMVDTLRDARSSLNFTLEQVLTRTKDLKQKLAMEEATAQRTRDQIRQIDDAISACALVAEQSAAIKPELLAPVSIHKKTVKEERVNGAVGEAKTSARWSNHERFLRQPDLVQFFALHPGRDWRAAEIKPLLPEIKREHATEYLPVLLAAMNKTGRIQRTGVGLYRAVGS